MTYNVGLRIFHSNAKKADYILFRKEIEETFCVQNSAVLGKLSKDERTVKSDCKNSNIKYEYLSDNVNRKEKMKYGDLPDSIRLFNSTGDGKTYLLTKDKSGQVRFYQQTAPNHFEFVSSKKVFTKAQVMKNYTLTDAIFFAQNPKASVMSSDSLTESLLSAA